MSLSQLIGERAREAMIIEDEIESLKAECEELQTTWLRSTNRDLLYLQSFKNLICCSANLEKAIAASQNPTADDATTAVAKEELQKLISTNRNLQSERARKDALVDDSQSVIQTQRPSINNSASSANPYFCPSPADFDEFVK